MKDDKTSQYESTFNKVLRYKKELARLCSQIQDDQELVDAMDHLLKYFSILEKYTRGLCEKVVDSDKIVVNNIDEFRSDFVPTFSKKNKNPYEGLVSEDLKSRAEFNEDGVLVAYYEDEKQAQKLDRISVDELLDIARKVIKIEMGLEGKSVK